MPVSVAAGLVAIAVMAAAILALYRYAKRHPECWADLTRDDPQ